MSQLGLFDHIESDPVALLDKPWQPVGARKRLKPVGARKVLPPCVNCKKSTDQSSRYRKLCWSCHQKPEIRQQYLRADEVGVKPAPTHCRHCQRPRPQRPRGLCCPCYDDLSIRQQYSTANNLLPGIVRGTGAEPEPTRARPGTDRKVEVMAERAARGEALFSSRDRQRDLT